MTGPLDPPLPTDPGHDDSSERDTPLSSRENQLAAALRTEDMPLPRVRLIAVPDQPGTYVAALVQPPSPTEGRGAPWARWPRWGQPRPPTVPSPRAWPALAQRIVAWGAERGLTLLPAWCAHPARARTAPSSPAPDHWAQVEQLRHLTAGTTSPALAALQGSPPPAGRAVRRLLRRELRQHRMVLTYLRRHTTLAYSLRTDLALASFQRCIALYCLWRGLPFDGSATCRAAFADLAAAGSVMTPGHVDRYFVLLGWAWSLSERPASGAQQRARRLWVAAATDLGAFIDAFRRDISVYYRWPWLRRAGTAWRWGQQLTVAALLVALALLIVVRTRPLPPVDDESVITAPGGLQGRFFKGALFQQALEQTVVKEIDFRHWPPRQGPGHAKQTGIRWQGFLRFSTPGRHRVCSEHDGRARLFLGQRKIIDDWKEGGARAACSTIRVRQGWYPLRAEYLTERRWTVMRLRAGPELRASAIGSIRRGAFGKLMVPVVPSRNLCCTDSPDSSGSHPIVPR